MRSTGNMSSMYTNSYAFIESTKLFLTTIRTASSWIWPRHKLTLYKLELRPILPAGVFFFGVYSWLVKVLGQFSIIYFRGLGLRIWVRVWVRVRVRVRVRVSVVLWSE